MFNVLDVSTVTFKLSIWKENHTRITEDYEFTPSNQEYSFILGLKYIFSENTYFYLFIELLDSSSNIGFASTSLRFQYLDKKILIERFQDEFVEFQFELTNLPLHYQNNLKALQDIFQTNLFELSFIFSIFISTPEAIYDVDHRYLLLEKVPQTTSAASKVQIQIGLSDIQLNKVCFFFYVFYLTSLSYLKS